MFSSPCSLRSTQCAALIALAAAAGISRFESAPAKTTAPRPVAGAQNFAAVISISRAQIYFAAMQTLVTQVHVARVTVGFEPDHATGTALLDLAALAADELLPPAAPAAASPLSFSAPAAPALSARKHSFPYAVGPPRRRISTPLRAAGTEVPGDSSARRSQVSRIATVSILILRARVTRATDQGPESAGSLLSPSSALRGESGFFPSFVRLRPRFCAPT